MEQTPIYSVDEFSEPIRDRVIEAARAVFWETAQQTDFSTQEERDAYEWRYFGYYLEGEPSSFMVAVDDGGATADYGVNADGGTADRGNSPTVLGYICGVTDTRNHPELYRVAPHIAVFDDLYGRYPAHLHINLTAASRGRGLGGALIGALETRVRRAGASGLHLVTSPDARNVTFYHRNGFTDRYERSAPEDPEAKMLLMGKTL
jgi:ribosomal protein S18 acetylase RimI-like enzyme